MCFWLFKQKQRVTVINEKAQSDFYDQPQKECIQLAPWHQMQGYNNIIDICYIQTTGKQGYYANLPHQIFQCKHTQGIAASLRSCLYILHPLV